MWKQRINGLLDRTLEVFFSEGPAIEVSCELPDHIQCKTDMLSFKGYLLRWMASTSQVAPFTHDKIMAALKKNAQSAIKSCNGAVCGFRWTTGNYDQNTGAGQQMNVIAALTTLLVDQVGVKLPATAADGGISVGDPNAGGQGPSRQFAPITTADRAGAGILTFLTLAGGLGVMYWLNTGMSEAGGPWYRPFH